MVAKTRNMSFRNSIFSSPLSRFVGGYASNGTLTEFNHEINVLAGGQGFTRLHNQRRGCPILARPLRKSGNHTDRTMVLTFHGVGVFAVYSPLKMCYAWQVLL